MGLIFPLILTAAGLLALVILIASAIEGPAPGSADLTRRTASYGPTRARISYDYAVQTANVTVRLDIAPNGARSAEIRVNGNAAPTVRVVEYALAGVVQSGFMGYPALPAYSNENYALPGHRSPRPQLPAAPPVPPGYGQAPRELRYDPFNESYGY